MKQMKVFRELSIKGSSERLAAFIHGVTLRLADGWRRETEREGQSIKLTPGLWPMFCFTCPKAQGRGMSEIWIAHRSANELFVSNVIPHSFGQLSYEQYNEILCEFHDQFARPAAEEQDLRIELSADNVDLEAWLSPLAAEALRSFSNHANKSTGASHPLDRERWYKFLILSDKEKSTLDASTLARWLSEEAGWADTTASELADDYERARSLLAYEHAG
jgi:hypothetical protein